MLNENDRQLLADLKKTNPELDCLVSKMMKQYEFDISRFSHELRNPITLISSSLQLIESQHPEVKDFKFWKETMDDMQFVCSLLDELSSFNKCASLHITKYSIRELLDSTCSAVYNNMNKHAQKFTYSYADTLPVISGDPVKIREVLINLLKNAKDAIDPDTGFVHLTAYKLNEDNICIEIKDNGCGIPPEHYESVFEPFVTYKASGSGLGLPICKKIIQSHNGSIYFETLEGAGTTFYITLPVEP